MDATKEDTSAGTVQEHTNCEAVTSSKNYAAAEVRGLISMPKDLAKVFLANVRELARPRGHDFCSGLQDPHALVFLR
jgi:hypothetical protein